MSPECSQSDMNTVPAEKHNNYVQNVDYQFQLKIPNHNNNNNINNKNDVDVNKDISSMENSVIVEKNAEKEVSEKICNDSSIKKILTKENIEGIKQTQIFCNDGLENSDSSESASSKGEDADADECVEKKKKERKIREEEQVIKERLSRQVRSMSEGAAVVHHLSKDGDVMVFPNLQDDALDALGLMVTTKTDADKSKERLTEEEIELKFQTLSLAFSIDAVTVRDRLERQKRQRDQAEENLNAEIERFITAIHKLHPLCVDAETTELVTALLDRLQLIVLASQRISTSAEIFGSVQQEWRIAECVNLMLAHLRNLIKQRDVARRQLQITKRMLHETTTPPLKKSMAMTMTTPSSSSSAAAAAATAGLTRRLTVNDRRASIAAIPQPRDGRKIPFRRTSEGASGVQQEVLSTHWDRKNRSQLMSRPSRLELNPELTKIQEGSNESFTSNADSSDEDVNFETPMATMMPYCFTLRQQYTIIRNYALRIFNNWLKNGIPQEMYFMGAFAVLIVAMATIYLCSTFMQINHLAIVLLLLLYVLFYFLCNKDFQDFRRNNPNC